MTINTSNNTQTFFGNGVTTVFTTNFVPDSASDLVLTLSTSSTAGTVIASNLYNVSIGAPPVNAIWGQSATITYPLTGGPISSGTYLTVSRILPFTQPTSFINQGNVWPNAVETAFDILAMQIQQLASRTSQFRGIWATGIQYNVGDIVQDGANGNKTNNYYICQIGNISGVWMTDFQNGDWDLSVLANVPAGSNSLTLTGDITAAGSLGTSIATTLATVNSNVGTFASATFNAKGLATAAEALSGDLTTSGAVATLATVNSNVGSFTNSSITVDGKGRITAASSGSSGSAGAMILLSSQTISSSTASVSDTTHITSAYSHYVWEISNLQGVSNNVDAYITIQQSGSFVSSDNYYSTSIKSNQGSNSGYQDNGNPRFVVTGGVGEISSSEPSTIRFEFWQPTLVAPLNVIFDSLQYNAGSPTYVKGGGILAINAATTGIKLALSSGNIATCQANLYGIS